MWVVALLMFFSLLVAAGFLAAYIWAVRHGQFDDKYTPSVRILLDDENTVLKNADRNNSKKDNGQKEKQ